jgi:hypothetical protein
METKVCERCGNHFHRAVKLSENQWLNRRFCSKRCSAIRRIVSDGEILKMYADEKLSSTEISKKCGITSTQVLRVLSSVDAEIRCASENKKLSCNKPEFKEKMRNSRLGKSLSETAKEKLAERIGEKSPLWKGGITISSGYLQFTGSKANGDNAGKAIHTIIAEWIYGRKVKNGEHVHHIDGNKLNNNPENICILSASEHAKLHKRK